MGKCMRTDVQSPIWEAPFKQDDVSAMPMPCTAALCISCDLKDTRNRIRNLNLLRVFIDVQLSCMRELHVVRQCRFRTGGRENSSV
ncbi:hypothetical protein TNCV_1583681 [Trichonephila clavipes]|nr:hypothetical protein TNCV_1583681 [Trichonephila clavipes]